MAVEKFITAYLDLWTAAVKRRSATGRGSSRKVELYGIKKLRELILELAIRGLLVQQDPSDEPAGDLLKKIATEKAKLAKASKTKKDELPPPVTEGEMPFELPRGWAIARLGEIIKISSGDGLTSAQMTPNGDIPVYGGNGVNGYHDQANIDKPTLVIGRVGFYCGSIHITPHKAWITDNAFITSFPEELFTIEYLALLLQGTNLKENENATAQPVISGRKVYPIPVCFPPIKEQRRIVAKVDALMALCDEMEQQTVASLSAHQTLVEILLYSLTRAADYAQFVGSWQRIAEHFDALFTTEESIDQLKQAILQLAVMGKLVPQVQADEPVSELLKTIVSEKAKLAKEGKIKKEKPLPPIEEKEKPFVVPERWSWVRLGQLGICSTGKTPSTKEPSFFDGNIPFIGPGQISPGGELLDSEKFVSEEGLCESTEALPEDVLMVCIGGSIGKAVIAERRLAFNQQINAIRPISMSSKYLFYAISTNQFFDSVIRQSSGSATPIINRSKWEELLIPVCSEREQRHIVAKIDELITLCDRLKDLLIAAKSTQINMADSIKITGANL